MDIWFITQTFTPEKTAAAQRLTAFVQVWQKEGHEVTVLTGHPNQPSGRIPSPYDQRGSFHEDMDDGFRIWRHWHQTAPASDLKKMARSHFTFGLGLLRNLFGRQHLPDVIFASSPSFFGAFAGVLLARRYKVPFVVEVRELWPDTLVEQGIMRKGWLFNMLKKAEAHMYKKADAILTPTKGYARRIVEMGGDAKKIYLITDGVTDDALDTLADIGEQQVESLRTELQINPLTRIVLYMGDHGLNQALGQVVDAAKILLPRSDIVFLLVGDGGEKERIKKISRGLPNVQFITMPERERLWSFLKLAYVGIVPQKDAEVLEAQLPDGIFDVMAAGNPVVAAVSGEAADVVTKSGGGLVTPPEEPEKLAYAILSLIDHPDKAKELGQNSAAFVAKHHRQSTIARQVLAIVDKVA